MVKVGAITMSCPATMKLWCCGGPLGARAAKVTPLNGTQRLKSGSRAAVRAPTSQLMVSHILSAA